MKNKGLKILSLALLLSTGFVAGCSCSSVVTNTTKLNNETSKFLSGLTKDASDLTLKDLYDALISNDAGNKASADKLVSNIGGSILFNDEKNDWKSKYDKILADKLKEDKKGEEYQLNGKFNEAIFVATLKSQGYKVEKTENGYDYSEYLKAKYDVEAISTLLKQKYIQEEILKDKKNTIDKKKIRDVQYITITSSVDDEYDAYKQEIGNSESEEIEISAREFMRYVRDTVIEDMDKVESNLNDNDYFEKFEKEFQDKLKLSVDTEISKINTSDDYSNAIINKYTNNFKYPVEEGRQLKMNEINELEYSFNKIISSDTKEDEVVSSTITTRLLSLSNPEENKKTVIKIGDWFYLVSSHAGDDVSAKDILLTETSDSSVYTYSIVRFKAINKDNYEKEENLSRVIEHLAENSTLGNSAVSFYLGKNKNTIVVKDDSIYKYLKALYPDVFTD